MIAIFLIFRLKNILGTKTGVEETNINKKSTDEEYSNVVTLKSKVGDLEDIELTKILKVDPTLVLLIFCQGLKHFLKWYLKVL